MILTTGTLSVNNLVNKDTILHYSIQNLLICQIVWACDVILYSYLINFVLLHVGPSPAHLPPVPSVICSIFTSAAFQTNTSVNSPMSGYNVISKPNITVRKVVEGNDTLVNHKSLTIAKWLHVLQFSMPHKTVEEGLHGFHVSARNSSIQTGQENYRTMLLI
jgi:hypothetical protein